jgi:hypothetical protein
VGPACQPHGHLPLLASIAVRSSPVPTCIERCCYPLPCLLALALSHASVAALCCLTLLLAEQLHAATATAHLVAAAVALRLPPPGHVAAAVVPNFPTV